MDKKELFKTIDIDERKFVLCKFNAKSGSYILFKLASILTPLFNNLKDTSDIDDINLTELASSLFSLSEEDFRYIQDNCLKSVKEILPGATTQVLNEFGVWGAEDIEFDTQLVLNLTIKSLVFNVTPFFTGSLLSSLSKGLASFQQNSKI
ncbi:phage tail assembly chaperone [Clostridium tagluense]|uniref:phage tail assembly chaperone n=1 Tax=Clostridium tagluense TaxID=360422 RepID=UPI001CF4AA87|nr:hypothetical protein [Clostridium tagluense]MCB2297798.1 hypothetical protein [Clostridium tagluense]